MSAPHPAGQSQERSARGGAQVLVDDDVLAERRAKMEASERPWQPKDRDRKVSTALRAYAKLATSADQGAVRKVD